MTEQINVLPDVNDHYTPDRYAARWISRAISTTNVEPPEERMSGEHYELLSNIYTAHLTGGIEGAQSAWRTVSKFMPGMAALVRNPDNEVIHANQLINLPRPKYMIDEYPLYEHGLNVIVGESGSGKSFLALDIAAKAAQQKSVVYIVGEGLYGYAARWECWKQHNKSDADLWFYPKELDFSDMNALDGFIDMIQDKQPRLVIVDTVARCMGELDENSTKDMGLFIMRTSRIREQLGCGVLLVHHTGKNGIMRGSSALYGAADGILFVSKADEVISIFNDRDRGGKNKDGKPWDPMHRQMIPVNVERNGEMLDSVVLVPTEQIEYDLSNDDLLTEKQSAILDAIETFGGSSTSSEIMDITNLPKATVFRNIKQLIHKNMIEKDGNSYVLVSQSH